MLVDGLQIFLPTECMLRDCVYPVLGASILPCQKATLWLSFIETHLVFDNKFFAHIFEVAFAHAFEAVTNILFDKFILLIYEWREVVFRAVGLGA